MSTGGLKKFLKKQNSIFKLEKILNEAENSANCY